MRPLIILTLCPHCLNNPLLLDRIGQSAWPIYLLAPFSPWFMTNMVWLGLFKSANKVVVFRCFQLFNQIGQRLRLVNPKHSCPPLNNSIMVEFSRLVLLQHFSTVGTEQLILNCPSAGQTIHLNNILNNTTARGDVHIQTRFERINTSGVIHSRCVQ